MSKKGLRYNIFDVYDGEESKKEYLGETVKEQSSSLYAYLLIFLLGLATFLVFICSYWKYIYYSNNGTPVNAEYQSYMSGRFDFYTKEGKHINVPYDGDLIQQYQLKNHDVILIYYIEKNGEVSTCIPPCFMFVLVGTVGAGIFIWFGLSGVIDIWKDRIEYLKRFSN